MNELLTTKQFANMCGVEKRTLFYYDEIDLLKPAHRTEAGYRLYLPEQIDTLSMIKALQSVGMSLEEIRALMHESDLDHCNRLLYNQILLLRQKQEELKQAEQMLAYTIKELAEYSSIGYDNFHITEETEELLITQPITAHSNVYVNYLTYGYHHGVTIENWSTMYPELVYKKALNHKQANARKPAGTYGCVYLFAPNGEITQTIHKFIQLLQDKSLETEGPIYMEEISNDFIRFPNQNYLFKFTIKIHNKKIP